MSVWIRAFGAFAVLAIAVIVAMAARERFNQPSANKEQVLHSDIYDTPVPADWRKTGPPPCIIIADGASFSVHSPCDREQAEENRKSWEAAMHAREEGHRQAEAFRKMWEKPAGAP